MASEWGQKWLVSCIHNTSTAGDANLEDVIYSLATIKDTEDFASLPAGMEGKRQVKEMIESHLGHF